MPQLECVDIQNLPPLKRCSFPVEKPGRVIDSLDLVVRHWSLVKTWCKTCKYVFMLFRFSSKVQEEGFILTIYDVSIHLL